MENIIVYVDDAAYAAHLLEPMLADHSAGNPARWIVVGCAPRITHRASKWVTNSARESWRGKWAEKVFAGLHAMLERHGDTVITRLAGRTLCLQTQLLIGEFGAARVLDARRPKLGQDMQPVTSAQPDQYNALLDYAAALAGAGLLVVND
jgi:hypothetical protein